MGGYGVRERKFKNDLQKTWIQDILKESHAEARSVVFLDVYEHRKASKFIDRIDKGNPCCST